jgi:hypothetical protein
MHFIVFIDLLLSPVSSPSTPSHDYSFLSCKCNNHHHKCNDHHIYKPVGISIPKTRPNTKLTKKQSHHLKKMEVWMTGVSFNQASIHAARKVALLLPSKFLNLMKTSEEADQIKHTTFPLIWDTGASICVTPDKSDFIDYDPKPDIKEVKGLGGKSSKVAGQGLVLWSLHDCNGTLRHLKLKAYHIPASTTRLISTSSLLRQYTGEHLTVDGASLKLSGIDNDPLRSLVIAFNNPNTNIPTTIAYKYNAIEAPSVSLCHVTSTVHAENHNLSEST